MVTIRAILAIIVVIQPLTSAATETPTSPDVAGRVRSCEAISDETLRLKCFDDLFGRKVGVSPTVTESKMEWSVEQRNAEDGPEVTAAMVAGDTALILRCKDQNTEVAFSTKYNYLGSKSVIFQIGAVSGIKDKIGRACNWPDPEPIGSTGHSERP